MVSIIVVSNASPSTREDKGSTLSHDEVRGKYRRWKVD